MVLFFSLVRGSKRTKLGLKPDPWPHIHHDLGPQEHSGERRADGDIPPVARTVARKAPGARPAFPTWTGRHTASGAPKPRDAVFSRRTRFPGGRRGPLSAKLAEPTARHADAAVGHSPAGSGSWQSRVSGGTLAVLEGVHLAFTAVPGLGRVCLQWMPGKHRVLSAKE